MRYTTGSRTPSAYDSDSLRSRESKLRPQVDMQFGLKRFMDDLGKNHTKRIGLNRIIMYK